MMLVNHKVVVTQEQLNLLALQAAPVPSDSWMHNEALAQLTGLPILVAPEDGTPIDCGDGWLAAYKWDSLYAWNDAEIKANLERVVQESIGAFAADNGMDGRSVGLFQQTVDSYYRACPKNSLRDLGGIL